MRRLGMLLLCGTLAFARPAVADEKPHYERLMNAIPVATTGTADSSVQDLRTFGTHEAIFFIASSAGGDADVKIEYLLSLDGTTYTDVAAFADLTSSTATAFTAAPEGLNRILLPVLPGRYVKFRVTGVGSNAADTVVSLWFAGRGVIQ